MKGKIILQVALDFIELKRALQVASEAVDGGADWIEAGTPLIKSEGLDAVRRLKKIFPKHVIVADMKAVDTGRLEVEAAAKAGASVVTVLASADDSTIKEAVEAAVNYGCKIMADLMNVEDAVKRAEELCALGVDYICVHASIDQQMRGVDPIKQVKEIAVKVDKPVAVAGGINSESAAEAVKAGADIVIVGGAITKAVDARKAAAAIKKAMETSKPVKTKLYKKYMDPLEAFRKTSTANISDAMHRSGEMSGIFNVSGGMIVGRALTVRTAPGDWAKPVEAVDLAEEGDVIVVDAGGVCMAVWGELASESAVRRKVSGVVIDGGVRDVDSIRKMKLPVYARHITPTAGEPKGLGEINVPIKCGGVLVKPGDYVIADQDGVVVVPKDKAVETANRALDILEKENRLRCEIRRGSTLSEVAELHKWEKKR